MIITIEGSKVTIQIDEEAVTINGGDMAGGILLPSLSKKDQDIIAKESTDFNPNPSKHSHKPGPAQRAWNGSSKPNVEGEPRPTPPTPPIPIVNKQDKPTTFADPWDCGNCRGFGRLCLLHQKMQSNGQKPLKGEGVPNSRILGSKLA